MTMVWGIDRGYNRNESSPFPIMFMVKSEQKKQQYHYYPEADIKLCWMSFHNLHQATYKQKKEVRQAAVFPSMFHANGIMKLFLCGFCATEQVHFFCARQYDSGVFHEALQLMHNMFNLRDHQYGVKSLEDNQEEVALQSFLKTALGKNLNLTQEPSGNSTQESSGTLGSNPVGTLKRPRESTGDDSGRATPSKRPRTDGATESEAEMPSERFFPEIDDYVKFMFNADTVCRQRGIMINRVDGSFEIVPPNRQVRTAEWRGKPIVLKFVPHRSTELSFLLLLNSDHMRSRPGNRTIELLNHFAVDDEFDCLMLPRVSMFDEAPALTPSEMLSLAQQARGYAAFLESVGLVHRDLKLENVGFLPGRTGTGAGDTGAQLAVLDLGRMERRDPSDLVREYYVPRNCCPPEFFQSSEGCSPFVMDAFAAGVIATELENRANAHPTTTTRLSVGAEEVAAASSVHDHETA
ncbi:hypothetical protein HK405_005530 [Cladochytrium tenue]|nr:hypothetical protein HK405_005530 [Cladochytrium tenue]